MSRIIVKNLPKKVSAKKLEDLFSSKGCITDLQLKYTKTGVFRQFAFVGYKTEEEAKAAKEYFHDTFVDVSKINVEVCANLGDTDKPRAWSKYAKDKASPVKGNQADNSESSSSKKQKKKSKKEKSKQLESENRLENYPEELKSDKLFAEFLDVHKARSSKPLWSDAPVLATDEGDDNNDEASEENSGDDQDSKDEIPSIAKKSNVSDMEYLRTKMKTSEVRGEEDPGNDKAGEKSPKKKSVIKTDKALDDRFTVKLRNLPFRCKKKQIKQFFLPLKPESLRIPPKSKGFAYVKFKSEKDMKQALNKSKCILEGHKIDVIKYEKKETESLKKSAYQSEDKEKTGEELAETGRIFVRNLCFSVTEEDLQKVFSKYGPISEIHLPIDAYTKKSLGFAFVAFLFPEHAVKAFSELDGTIFQGRLLHLIPAKPKREVSVDVNNLPFKKKKEAKMKALSGSSHNWNTLFLGMNAVADVISKKYNIDKSQLLNDGKDSIAVRIALGETQLVVETRKFLLEKGVQLDAFSQAATERSKTVILAKNLPANTSSEEILNIFSKHGIVSRVVLPPSGITALIAFQEPAEAKLAFKRLAYTRFHHMPLYLEWAPINIFKDVNQQKNSGLEDTDASQEMKDDIQQSSTVIENDDEEPEPGSVLFVKNLNFETTEESLRKHFKKCGTIHAASISMKKDLRSGNMLSMGFGFIHFKQKSSATQALQDLQNSTLGGHKLELKFSNKATLLQAETHRRKATVCEQKTSKILVRNIPFEVTKREIGDLFNEFGMLESVRLPKKPSGEGSHRGFGFVDFRTKSDAKRAFDALCHSTHLLGRRLVLEWANPDTDEVPELRKKTARDFYTEGPKAKLKKSKFLQDAMMSTSKPQDDD